MAREEKEGPPAEVFKKKMDEDEEINEKTIYETDTGEDYDEDALRTYQLERLRYVSSVNSSFAFYSVLGNYCGITEEL